MKNLRFPTAAMLMAAVFMAGSANLRADDVTDSIDEALEAYKDKDYLMATQALETALQLIKQKKGETLAKLLPEAPKGWKAEEAESQAAAAAFFGGGITAERSYSKGDAYVTVKYTSDSPMLQGIMMMMGNPMFASSDGGKLIRLKGQRALLKYDSGDKSGSIQFTVNNMLLVEVEGDSVTEDDLKLFAEAVPVDKITPVL